MGAALAFVYVSLSEGFGLPVLEAMHCDIPVITSDCTSLPEVAGQAALLVDPASVSSISDAMHRLFTDESLRKELILRGREQRRQFSWQRSAEKVYRILRSCSGK